MKVIVAMDSIKGTMSARDACACVRDGIRAVREDVDVVLTPMADGGEGTAEALMTARGGSWVEETVTGPLPDRSVKAGYAWFADDESAVVEMAAASGIMLVDRAELNPLIATTYGTGELIRAALRRGAKRLILAVGGSATVDGGVGAAMALGWQFLDQAGQSVGLGGAALEQIATIHPPRDPIAIPVEVLCDVDNPLTGEHGAAAVFGPQKGATPEMVTRLDGGLRHLAAVVREQLGTEIDEVPGAGAAGGLSAGALAFMNARLVPGIDTVITASGLDRQIEEGDWIVSGEGRFDSQSLRGKVVSGIVKLARSSGAKVAVIAGTVKVPESEAREWGVEVLLQANKPGMPLEEAIAQTRESMYETAQKFARDNLA